jgi:hypothetical protein
MGLAAAAVSLRCRRPSYLFERLKTQFATCVELCSGAHLRT